MMNNKVVGYEYRYTLTNGEYGVTYFPARSLAQALVLIARLKELKPIESGILRPDVRLQSDVETSSQQLTLKIVA